MRFSPNTQIVRLLKLKDFFFCRINKTYPAPNSSTQITGCRHALNSETIYNKNMTGIRFLQSLMQSRSNEKSIEIWSAKGAGSSFQAG